MWVIKLGGSLYKTRRLREWLDLICRLGAEKLVLVPGGGPFADQVRNAQQQWKFDDTTGHHMALLGMEQYGLMLSAMHDDLEPTYSMAEILCALDADKIPVWMPTEMILADNRLQRSWNITSDSLSAWLVRAIGASHCSLDQAK